jgi:hypothetical protein
MAQRLFRGRRSLPGSLHESLCLELCYAGEFGIIEDLCNQSPSFGFLGTY